MLGGELGNSSASDLEYLKPVWSRLVEMHLNALVVPVYWELVEPKEGVFDFTLVDSIITSARLHTMKLVFLWFGTWKNSMSCYVPLWIKSDQQRFPRARQKDGRAEEILTAFDKTNRTTDARAFATLMKHIRSIDEKEQTVVLVQVENEIGMIPDARDYSESANESFKAPVPAKLISYLKEHKDGLNPEMRTLWEKNGFKSNGNWEEIFGNGLSTDEVFMAWNYAEYANFVAEAGKREYPLPMYVNAALYAPDSNRANILAPARCRIYLTFGELALCKSISFPPISISPLSWSGAPSTISRTIRSSSPRSAILKVWQMLSLHLLNLMPWALVRSRSNRLMTRRITRYREHMMF